MGSRLISGWNPQKSHQNFRGDKEREGGREVKRERGRQGGKEREGGREVRSEVRMERVAAWWRLERMEGRRG